MIAGLVNKEISEELGVTLRTVMGTSLRRDAEHWRALRGGTGEIGVGRGRLARAARHRLKGQIELSAS